MYRCDKHLTFLQKGHRWVGNKLCLLHVWFENISRYADNAHDIAFSRVLSIENEAKDNND